MHAHSPKRLRAACTLPYRRLFPWVQIFMNELTTLETLFWAAAVCLWVAIMTLAEFEVSLMSGLSYFAGSDPGLH